MALTRSQQNALLRKLEGPVRRAYLEAVRTAQSRASIAALEKALVAGDIDAILLAAGIRDGMWTNLNEKIRAAYVESGTLVMYGDLPRGVDLDFDINNPRAEAWLKSNSSKLVQGLKKEQELATQEALRSGMVRGSNPRTTALDIAGRINKTGRRAGGIIHLTEGQAEYVSNMAKDLDELNWSRYKTRKLRDRRFDSVVKRAWKEGKPLPQATKNKIINRYSDRWLKHRADTIARTETLGAINASGDEALHQVVESGLAPRHAAIRIWRHSYSKNERGGHVMMSGQQRGLDEMFVNPLTFTSLMYPHDPSAGPAEVVNCRCYIEHQIDFAAVELVA